MLRLREGLVSRTDTRPSGLDCHDYTSVLHERKTNNFIPRHKFSPLNVKGTKIYLDTSKDNDSFFKENLIGQKFRERFTIRLMSLCV